MRRTRWGSVAVLATCALLALGACSADDEGASATTSTTDTASGSTSTSTSTSTTRPPVECDAPDAVLAEIDAGLAEVGLVPGSEWDLDVASDAFGERMVDPGTFVDRLALDCAVSAVQSSPEGGEREVLAAWTGDRLAWIVQSTDGPVEPYAQIARFDLLVEWTYGQYFRGPIRPNRDDETLWAGTLETGETFVVFSRDYPTGAVAKSWWTEFPPPMDPDEYVTLDAERFGIDALEAAGARNVGIAEQPEIGSEVGSLQAVSPTGQVLEVRVAPPGWFDPTTDWHQTGVVEQVEIDGVTVYVSEAGPPDDANVLTYDVVHLSFECGDWVWQVITGFGTTEELQEFVEDLLGVMECDSIV